MSARRRLHAVFGAAMLCLVLFAPHASRADGAAGAAGTLFDPCALAAPPCGRVLTFSVSDLAAPGGVATIVRSGSVSTVRIACASVTLAGETWVISASGAGMDGSTLYLAVRANGAEGVFGFAASSTPGTGTCGSPAITAVDAQGAVFAQPAP